MIAAPRIAVLGSANMDLIATTDRRPAPGETIFGSDLQTIPGGKGLNQAIAAKRAGGAVEFLGATGNDGFGQDLRDALVGAGVGTRRLRTLPGASGVALITVDANAENSILVISGANSAYTALTSDELATITAVDILLCQLEVPLATVTAAAAHARANGVTVMLNPSPAQGLPQELRENTDVVIVNAGEAEELGASLDGIAHMVTTLGADGARYRGPDGESFTTPAVPVAAIDTTGAGDAFAGALAVAWRDGPETALHWACAAGALATTKPGASSSAPTRARIERTLAAAGVPAT